LELGIMSNWQSSYRFSANPQGKSHAEGGSNPVNSDSSPYLEDQYPDSLGSDVLSIALIGPDEERRKAAATALAGCRGGEIREFSTYPPSLDDVPRLLEQHYDVIIIDLDSHPEYALELVESICANGTATVMVYSVKADSELLVRCMRAGAREFLTLPFAQSTMAEALVRASARRPATRAPKKASGRLLVFLGAKGGDGATTLACNFAVSMAQESGQSTLLIDLDLPLGDAALNLGVVAEYSTINALQNANRLDSSFLSKLLVKHSSGVSVLAAPGKFPQYQASNEAIDRLVAVARQDFDNVVVDLGSRLDLMGTSLFKDGAIIYLVIQAGIAGLRNSNRLISQFFSTGIPKLEIVLNRFEPRSMGVSEDQIAKALTRPAQWKIPNDYAAVQRMQTTAVPLALEDSPISRLIRQMTRTACGLPAVQEKRAGFSLKSFSRGFSTKTSAAGAASALTQLGLGSGEDNSAAKADAPVRSAGKFSHPAAASETPLAATQKAQRQITATEKTERTNPPDAKREAPPSAATASQRTEPETRTYKGATYVKGMDGEWHIQETQTASASSQPAGSASQPASTPSQRTEPETRTYKGATYVKGADGEWQLQSPAEEKEPQAEKANPEPPQAEKASPETPVITWPTPAPISYGTALGAAELNATASVPGEFTYTPDAGEMLTAGVHALSATFTPADATGYATAQAAVVLTVTKATPATIWPTPAPIVYGTALSPAQLNAAASVPGRFVYTPAEGEVLTAGVQTLTAIFTPADGSGYTAAQAAVPFTVAKAKPTINWPAPASIPYGTPLGASQLNATASVAGSFSYTPAADAVPGAGVQTLSATFTPADATNYTTAHAEVSLAVRKVTPVITWPTPASIVYGTALGAAQLNATASVAGRFAYIPSAGAVLSAGTHTPSVIFTPADTANYTAAQAAVSLTVAKATPAITWPAPAPIAYGAALSAAQLNATASVPGSFAYTPAAGEVLAAGTHTLSATFTPADITDYAAVQAAVTLTVAKAKPTEITWPAPSAISHGVALSAAELNATAPIPGSFVYTPAAGEVLATGTHTLSVTFTPADANLPAAQATVSLTVTKATPVITWPAPAPIAYGTALSETQLNATASVSGSFVYTPAAGETLAAGTHELSVTFTPNNGADAAPAKATVSLSVSKATPIITWPAPEAISYGTPLSHAQLNATALIPGSFAYTPAAGTVIASGTQTLSVTFTPTDIVDYTTAQATVQLVVEGLPNIASLMPAMAASGTNLAGGMQGAQPGHSAANQQSKPETRTYKGATYVKGADGQWYLQKE
jgi:Flp pilus assembly CpaE family ATPase